MTETTFAPPGAGQWTAESAHAYGAMTPIGQHLMRTGMTKGVAQTFAEYGMPAETLDCRFVHGHMYTRLRPLVAPDRTATGSITSAARVTRAHARNPGSGRLRRSQSLSLNLRRIQNEHS